MIKNEIKYININSTTNKKDDYQAFFENSIKNGVRVIITSPTLKTGSNFYLNNCAVFGFYNTKANKFTYKDIKQQVSRIRNASHIYVYIQKKENDTVKNFSI